MCLEQKGYKRFTFRCNLTGDAAAPAHATAQLVVSAGRTVHLVDRARGKLLSSNKSGREGSREVALQDESMTALANKAKAQREGKHGSKNKSRHSLKPS